VKLLKKYEEQLSEYDGRVTDILKDDAEETADTETAEAEAATASDHGSGAENAAGYSNNTWNGGSADY